MNRVSALLATALFAWAPVSVLAAEFDGNIVLGAPIENSITANVWTATAQDVYIAYGPRSGAPSSKTTIERLSADQPVEFHLTGLQADTGYYYRLGYNDGGNTFLTTEEFSFHTPRRPGSSFVFGVQGDSHPERAPRDFIPELYTRTLAQANRDGVDFYFTIGDDFSIDVDFEGGISEDGVRKRYQIQRPWLGIVGKEAPVFLVNGNHEQAALYLYNDARKYPAPDNPAVWAQNARNEYFSQPVPNNFYSGSDEKIKYIDKGLTGSYYAFEWGDALFVTIDPVWFSGVPVSNLFEGPRGPPVDERGFQIPGAQVAADDSPPVDQWDKTLGDEQYNWLKQTLEGSDAKFKFIFTHLMHGGSRGGVELAKLYEWGGEDGNGNYQFDTQRPNWEKPLQQLMADTGVTIFFHGHDHVWVRQELDGVIYQEVGSPADPDYVVANFGKDYTDETSVALPNSGYMRVSVSAEQVQVDYVRTYLPEDENEQQQSGQVAYSYVVDATGHISIPVFLMVENKGSF
jgi:hypothetical protein